MMRRIAATLVFVFALATALVSGATFHAHSRAPRRPLHRVHARVARWNPVLRGSHDSLLRQNEEIDRLKLTRISDDQQLEELELSGELVSLHDSRSLQIAPNLELNRRFCRPWTRAFLEDLSQAFYAQFHQPIQVTSAVRTVDQQARLQRSNATPRPLTVTLLPRTWPGSPSISASAPCRAINVPGLTSMCSSCNNSDWWRPPKNAVRPATTSW